MTSPNSGSHHPSAGASAYVSSLLEPTVQLVPERPAICSDADTELQVLVRLIPPPAPKGDRQPLNLGLVLDRSGSMSGLKLEHAKEAAIFLVEQLRSEDRVSVTIFDDQVQTIVPSTRATDRKNIIHRLRKVHAGGSTALHAGWVEGGMQVCEHLKPGQLSRVLLLTDGQANVGITDTDAICSHVSGLAARGVSTSTLGVGNDYNEDLLEAMARSGDGNYYYIRSSSQLGAIFSGELQGLCATAGQTVSLGLEPQAGAEVIDVLNDLERNQLGRLMLPNLVADSPLEVLVSLRIPAGAESDLCLFRLAWTAPQTGQRHVKRAALRLPAVPTVEWGRLPIDADVQKAAALLTLARQRLRAVAALDDGDEACARRVLKEACAAACAAPLPASVREAELGNLADLDAQLSRGDRAAARKELHYEAFRRRRSQ